MKLLVSSWLPRLSTLRMKEQVLHLAGSHFEGCEKIFLVWYYFSSNSKFYLVSTNNAAPSFDVDTTDNL